MTRGVCTLFWVNDEKFSICMFKESVHTQYKEQWADDIGLVD